MFGGFENQVAGIEQGDSIAWSSSCAGAGAGGLFSSRIAEIARCAALTGGVLYIRLISVLFDLVRHTWFSKPGHGE